MLPCHCQDTQFACVMTWLGNRLSVCRAANVTGNAAVLAGLAQDNIDDSNALYACEPLDHYSSIPGNTGSATAITRLDSTSREPLR